MAACKTAYRVESRFKDFIELSCLEHLVIRQTGEAAFIITTANPNAGIEYVLATTRSPEEARTFTNLGRCVQFAIRLSGLKHIYFELIESLSDKGGDE